VEGEKGREEGKIIVLEDCQLRMLDPPLTRFGQCPLPQNLWARTSPI